MTVSDLFNYASKFVRKGVVEKVDVAKLCEYFELDTTRKISELSLGNRKKVGVIQALIKQPELLILDEPTTGLDPLMQTKFFEVIKQQKKKGVTVFLSSHNLSEIEKYCDRVAIIKSGKIIEIIEMKESTKLRKNLISYTTTSGKQYSEIFDGDINDLIQKLSKKKLLNLEIRPQTIEEEFEKYYLEEK